MNENQYERLKPYKHVWETYKRAKFVNQLSHEDSQIIDGVRQEIYKVGPTNLYCMTCKIDMLVQVFRLFDEYEESLEIKKVKEPAKKEAPKKQPVKKGRPKGSKNKKKQTKN